MARSIQKKRKAPVKEVEEEVESSEEEEFTADMIDGTLAQEDSEGSEDEDGEMSEREEFVELGSEDEEEGHEKRMNGVTSKAGAMSLAQTEEDSEDDEDDEDFDDEDEEDEDEEEDEEEDDSSYTEYEVDENLEDGVRIVKDSQGKPRYLYPEIDPLYDSDDTDVEETNTIGNIPLEFYEQYPHIGYDINGKRIMRPATGEALDVLLDQIDLPKGWTGQIDKNTGKMINLTKEELEILKKITRNEVAADGFDPYPEMIEYFTSKTEVMPLSAAPEPKRRFVPSKHEAKRVMKIVRAIREGRIVPNKPKVEEPEFFDLWADNAPPKPDHIMNIPAPKLPPPQHDESYNPPKEYLLNEQERKEWEETEPEDRRRDYMPASYSALRLVPGYEKNIKERFERCLDLYLAPRVRRKKLNIDPESLLPKLPSPQDLRPFPTSCATLYKGHEGRVRTVDIDPTGAWLATGGDDGTVRVWEILTGRQLWKMSIGDGKEAVNSIKWRPGTEAVVLAAAAGDEIHLLVPPIFDPEIEQAGREVLAAGWGYAKTNDSINAEKKENAAAWTKPARALEDAGVSVIISLKHTIKHLAWHRRGDYLASVAPEGQNRAVAIHQLTKHHSQHPFRKSKGIIQRVEFHPFKPILFVATQRYIRVYDLSKQDLIKTLQTGARWISSFDVHPGGDNVLVGTYDKRLLWHDLDLSLTPYKTMRYHDKAIRSVAYHQGGLPLFCSSSDDGTIQVFHGRVVTDLLENALIVPLKILRGHKVKDSLGVLDTVWHPKQPWLFSAGADGVARMWF